MIVNHNIRDRERKFVFCVEVIFVGERSCVLQSCITQILNGGSLCGKSCVDAIVKIFLCEGGDVELGARTSKHILVFAFDPLSLNSLLYCALHHIVHILYAWYCLCVPILEHLNSYLEEFRGDSLEPFTGNSVTLFGYTKCVAFSF